MPHPDPLVGIDPADYTPEQQAIVDSAPAIDPTVRSAEEIAALDADDPGTPAD